MGNPVIMDTNGVDPSGWVSVCVANFGLVWFIPWGSGVSVWLGSNHIQYRTQPIIYEVMNFAGWLHDGVSAS